MLMIEPNLHPFSIFVSLKAIDYIFLILFNLIFAIVKTLAGQISESDRS